MEKMLRLINDREELINWLTSDDLKLNVVNEQTTELKLLKDKVLRFYNGTVDSNLMACDVINILNHYTIQLKRLRMVINPKVYIASNVNVPTKHEYISIRSNWVDNNGKVIRILNTTLGRSDKYKGGIKSDEVYNDGMVKVKEKLWEIYKETYKK